MANQIIPEKNIEDGTIKAKLVSLKRSINILCAVQIFQLTINLVNLFLIMRLWNKLL